MSQTSPLPTNKVKPQIVISGKAWMLATCFGLG